MNRRPIIVLHGIYGHGGRGPDLVIPHLQGMGYEVCNYDYRWTSATTAGIRCLVVQKAKELCRTAERLHLETGLMPDILAHSFGVQLALRSCQHSLNQSLFRYAYLFHGAMRRNYEFPVGPTRQIHRVHNFAYRHDRALKSVYAVRALMPWHQFGQLGRLGYAGPVNASWHDHQLPFPPDQVENTHGAWFREGWPLAAQIILSGVRA